MRGALLLVWLSLAACADPVAHVEAVEALRCEMAETCPEPPIGCSERDAAATYERFYSECDYRPRAGRQCLAQMERYLDDGCTGDFGWEPFCAVEVFVDCPLIPNQ